MPCFDRGWPWLGSDKLIGYGSDEMDFCTRMVKHQNHKNSDSIHPQTLNEYQTSIFNAFFLWHDVCPQHMSRQRIHSGFPTLKFPQVLGFELGQKTHKKFMGFYGIITGKLWVFYGFRKNPGFWEIMGFYGKIMGFLWVNYGFSSKPYFFRLKSDKRAKKSIWNGSEVAGLFLTVKQIPYHFRWIGPFHFKSSLGGEVPTD